MPLAMLGQCIKCLLDLLFVSHAGGFARFQSLQEVVPKVSSANRPCR